jgi:hypothetical protein
MYQSMDDTGTPASPMASPVLACDKLTVRYASAHDTGERNARRLRTSPCRVSRWCRSCRSEWCREEYPPFAPPPG